MHIERLFYTKACVAAFVKVWICTTEKPLELGETVKKNYMLSIGAGWNFLPFFNYCSDLFSKGLWWGLRSESAWEKHMIAFPNLKPLKKMCMCFDSWFILEYCTIASMPFLKGSGQFFGCCCHPEARALSWHPFARSLTWDPVARALSSFCKGCPATLLSFLLQGLWLDPFARALAVFS